MAKHSVKLFKKARRYNFSLLESNKEFAYGKKRNYPPGESINPRFRRKLSNYGAQLQEKQKVKFMYGLSEKQLKIFFKKVRKQKSGVLGTNFLIRLESRLDNICYRFGVTHTRAAARQMVTHRHVRVNNKIINIPSYLLKPGDVVQISTKLAKNPHVLASLKSQTTTLPFVTFSATTLTGKYLR